MDGTLPGSVSSSVDIGRAFVRQYYTMLSERPEEAYRYYGKEAVLSHDRGTALGPEDIQKTIDEIAFHTGKFRIYSIQSLSTLSDRIVLQVVGEISLHNGPGRKFTQTFVLGQQQGKKFYVENDIFMYNDKAFENDGESQGAVTEQIQSTKLNGDLLQQNEPLPKKDLLASASLNSGDGTASYVKTDKSLKKGGLIKAQMNAAKKLGSQAVLDESIVQHVSSETSDLLTAEMSSTQKKNRQKAKKRPIVEGENGDADTRNTHETVTQEEALRQNSTIPTLDLLGCLKLDPGTLPAASISTGVPERKKRTIVGRRVLPLENIGITAEMIEEASKPIDEIQQLVERKALEESADQVERIARSLQSNCIQEAFTQAILEGKVDHARGLAKFHILCPMSNNFNIQETDEITGQNLLHKVCQVSCNNAKVRDPDYMHALCDATEYLIQSGLDTRQVDLSNKTALQYAVEKKLFCRVRRLLSLRAPVNFQGIELSDSLLYQAYNSNHRLIFKLLLDNGANFSQLEMMIAIGRIPHNRILSEVLKTHSSALKQRFNAAKRKVLVDIEEVHPVSPMYVANFYEGPTFWFDFHYHAEIIPTADYFFALFVATAVVDESNKWHMALWGDSPLKTEPVLNEEEMMPIQYIEQYGPMNTSSKKSAIFLGTPGVGANRFHVTLNQSKSPPPLGDGNAYAMCHNWKIVLQMSLLKKSKRKVSLKAPTSTQPILEHAPDAPSSYY